MMEARFIHDGKAVDYTPETDTSAGTVIVHNDLVGVTKSDIPVGRLGAVHVVGVYDVVKNDAAIPLGAKVYWDATAKQAVTTATGNKQLGIAIQAAEATDGTVRVRIGS